MNCDASVGRRVNKNSRSFKLLQNYVRGNKNNLPEPNYGGESNSEGGRNTRNHFVNKSYESNRTTRSNQGGHHQTSERRGRQSRNFKPPFSKNRSSHGFVPEYPSENSQPPPSEYTSYDLPCSDSSVDQQSSTCEEKIHSVSSDDVSESSVGQNIHTVENLPISDSLKSNDKTDPLHFQVGCGPTEKVIPSSSSELCKHIPGLQDGSSGYVSQDDGSVSDSSYYKPSETEANFVSLFGNCDLSESSTDGYIPPPTATTTKSNLTYEESCRRTVMLDNNSSCHQEIGTITSTLSVSDVEDFDPKSSSVTITVSADDSRSDECEETSFHDSLNAIDMVPEQIEAISKLLKRVENDRSSDNYKTWRKVVERLTRVVKKYTRGYWLQSFGSYVSGCAIGTSNINIALIPNSHINSSHKMLQEMVRLIQEEIPNCKPVYEGDQAYRNASVSFFEPETNIFCKIQILGNRDLCWTAALLRHYTETDERVKTLIIAVRHWAEVCEINEEENGRLHPLSYVLMMIHFLQQCDPPVLPVINPKGHQIKMEIEALQDNKQEVGYLWVEFLRYYSETFNWKDNVVSITSKEPVLKASKTYAKCWIAIEEPHDEIMNVAKSVVSQDVSNYIRMVFTKSYNYFLHPVSSDESDTCCELTEDSNGSELSTESNKEIKPSFDYDFYQDNFLNGLCFPVICYECDNLGHLCDACLHDENGMLHSLPKMTSEFLKVIDEALESVYRTNSLSVVHLKKRQNLVERLEKHLKKRLKDARVELIGSSNNGFGLKDSDVDLCFTLDGSSAENVDTKVMVRKIKNILLKNQDFTDVMYISSSKIPIVKFIDTRTKLRCDISIYNELAICNTRLLNAYSKIDERVRILGCAMKNLAKNACINDTVQRTLSSYSYILMVLYFLQQVEPPVIPVLQQLYDSNGTKPVRIVENQDVWFFKDIEKLGSVWKESDKNHQSVGELWVGLLEFYTTKFDFHHFISISQKSPLTELKKVSSSMLFNIQDPFIKDLNLGRRMSGDMSRRTLKALQRARILFGTPVPTAKPPSGFESFQDYFFSTLNLTDGRVSGKIECSLCGKFGHSEDKCKRHKLFPNRLFCNTPQKTQFQRYV